MQNPGHEVRQIRGPPLGTQGLQLRSKRVYRTPPQNTSWTKYEPPMEAENWPQGNQKVSLGIHLALETRAPTGRGMCFQYWSSLGGHRTSQGSPIAPHALPGDPARVWEDPRRTPLGGNCASKALQIIQKRSSGMGSRTSI